MNEKIAEIAKNFDADAVLGKVLGWIESAESFAIEQAPIIVQEILSWNFAHAGIWLTIGILIFIPSVIFFVKGIKNHWDELIIVPVCGGVIGSIMIIANVIEMVKIAVAPRLYLIEYLSNLVK